ncbi:MAG: sigma-70 family RNA polymerase sigma factor, partial [Planctomycetes bacterium]|nr:sigma-70 family RNA polymerase sigma factor [Planctomycetota bacterium]
MADMAHHHAKAWKGWLKEHGSRLYMYARQRCSCREDAEDMIQDALV